MDDKFDILLFFSFIYVNPEAMGNDQNEIYSKVVRAGKRTYFFDIKATKGNDLYLTLTESKKTYNDEGEGSYQKHKIFLYKEDFEKFLILSMLVIFAPSKLSRSSGPWLRGLIWHLLLEICTQVKHFLRLSHL